MRTSGSVAWVSPLVWMISGAGSLHAQDTTQQQAAALQLIRQTAADICITVTLEGSNRNADLSGEAQAKLAGWLGKVVDLGVSGAAKYQAGQYQGVLQQDLAAAIKNSNDCRLSVFNTLQQKLLFSGPAPAAADNQRRSQPGSGPNGALPDQGAGKRIGYGPFVIGDTMQAIRQSGVQGRFDKGKNGLTEFSIDTRIPIPTGPNSATNPQGTVIYSLDRGVVVAVRILLFERGKCEYVHWLQPLFSQMVMEMGDPTEGPKTSHEVGPLGGGPTTSNDITEYVFQDGGERYGEWQRRADRLLPECPHER